MTMNKAMDVVEVKVTLPAERLGAFGDLLDRFLKDEAVDPDSPDLAGLSSQSQLRRWTGERVHMWTVDGSRQERVLAAREFLRALSPRARAFLHYLLAQETLEAPAEEVARALNLDSTRALAGTLSSFGTVAKRIGRYQPFEWRHDPDQGTVYVIHPEIAEVFQAAISPDGDT